MPSTINTTAERFIAEGPFAPSVAIVIGILLALVFAWAIRRESHILGRPVAITFWSLRTLAAAIVLWMLLAPVKVLIDTSTTRRAVMIATDVSGSMLTVDPAGSSDDLRWVLARSKPGKFSATREADATVASIGIALRKLQSAREVLQLHGHERPLMDSVTAANVAIERAKSHVLQIVDAPAGKKPSEKCQALADRLIKLFDGAEIQSFGQVVNDLKKHRTPAQKAWQEGLSDLEHRVGAIKGVAQELARTAAENDGKHLASGDAEVMSSVQNANRLDRVLKSVDLLQANTLAPLHDKADIRFGAFDQSFRLLSGPPASVKRDSDASASNPDGPATVPGTDLSNLFMSLRQESSNQQLAAVFLLSDVAHNEAAEKHPRDAAEMLAGIPVYVVPIGNTQYVRDLRLRSVFAPAVAMRNDDIVIEASVQAWHCENELCVVQLMQDGKPIDQREVLLDSGMATRTVRFERHVATLGREQYRVSIKPIEGELTTDNNDQDFEVNVTRNEIKMLLADEFPRWEYRYLTQLFRRDTKVEVDELLFHPRMIATGRREENKSLPTTVDEWDHYDLVLLGDLPTEHFSVASQESLVEYMKQRGGTVVVIAGAESMPQKFNEQPLGEIIPVEQVDSNSPANAQGFVFHMTDEGRDHPAVNIGETEEENRDAWNLINHYSSLSTLSAWRRPKAAARTLIAAVPRDSSDPTTDAKNNAFLCWQPIGRGRIVYLSGPESYRLRFLRGDRLHYRFWGQLLRWAIAADLATGTKYVKVRTDKSRYGVRDTIQITVRLADGSGEPIIADGVAVKIHGSGEERVVALSADLGVPGEYRGEVRSLPAGDYRIEPIGAAVEKLQQEDSQEPASTSLTVQQEVAAEMADTRCDRALAQQIADATGGQVIPPTAIEEILALTNLEPIVSEKIQQKPLWVQWKYLWIVFGCLQFEWIIRRRLGLS